MTRSPAVAALALLLAPAACVNPDREVLEDLLVQSAELRDMQTARLALIGGVVSGSAELAITDVDEVEHLFPVDLRGSTLGIITELSVDPGWHGAVPIDLDELGGPVSGDLLLARYHGSVVGVNAGFGIVGRDLRNRHGATINQAYLAVGVGVFFGWEWLRIRLADEEDNADVPPDEVSAVHDR